MDKIECVVIGAGVIGLATALELALKGREVIVLEAEDGIGTGISSRNSEVVHAGMHYPTGSLKAQLCVEGNRRLYDFCETWRIPHQTCGKLIVATNTDQLPVLQQIMNRGQANGVPGLTWLSAGEARSLEPELSCVAAIHSPTTGIVDSHGLMKALLHQAEAHGAAIALRSPVIRGRAISNGVELSVGGPDPSTFVAEEVFNCAGLGAQQVAASILGVPPNCIPQLHLAKGNYYALATPAPFSRLIYPVPEAAGLGVHLTLDLGGQARFGPDVEWVDQIDFRVDPHRANGFYQEIRRYWPALPDGTLQPAYAGIRPKIQGPSNPPVDFIIQGSQVHGVRGLVNLFGIESPGLTASLALAVKVARHPH